MQTMTRESPPKPPTTGKEVASGYPDDIIRQLGDQIALLSRRDTNKLIGYIGAKQCKTSQG